MNHKIADLLINFNLNYLQNKNKKIKRANI